jgi:hypothetical protein
MKARFVVLLVIMAALASQNASAQTVKYSIVVTGTEALCYNAAFTAQIACTNPAAVAAPVTILQVGYGTKNAQGGCESRVETISALPPITYPPPSVENETVVKQVTDYDRNTGSGDYSITNYTGGSCNGVNFNSSGATAISTATAHFQDSENGNRRDYLDTTLTNPTNSIGSFTTHGVELALTTQ